jgi:hypothetical protein
LILLGESSLENALHQFMAHYHNERNHQGLNNLIPFPRKKVITDEATSGPIGRRDRLGGLLKFYYREAA